MCSWPTETWRKPGNLPDIDSQAFKAMDNKPTGLRRKARDGKPTQTQHRHYCLVPGYIAGFTKHRINNEVSCYLSDLEWRYTHVIYCCQVTCGCRRHKNLASALAASKFCYVVSEEITGLRVCVYLSYGPISNQVWAPGWEISNSSKTNSPRGRILKSICSLDWLAASPAFYATHSWRDKQVIAQHDTATIKYNLGIVFSIILNIHIRTYVYIYILYIL